MIRSAIYFSVDFFNTFPNPTLNRWRDRNEFTGNTITALSFLSILCKDKLYFAILSMTLLLLGLNILDSIC